jgi:hypothetical protein
LIANARAKAKKRSACVEAEKSSRVRSASRKDHAPCRGAVAHRQVEDREGTSGRLPAIVKRKNFMAA